MRSLLAFTTAIPLTLGGSLTAHQVAYRIADPEAEDRAHLLARTGHQYLTGDTATMLVASALVLLLLGLVMAARRRVAARVPGSLFAVTPVLTFTVQEHVERLLHSGTFPWAAVTEPTFLPGLLLQLPFALLAWLVCGGLVRVAVTVGTALGSRRSRHVPKLRRSTDDLRRCWSRAPTTCLRTQLLANVVAGRAPPALPVLPAT